MTKEQIDEMIECRDVYEIEYEKDQVKRIRHISNIEYSGKCILAFCYESKSDLLFNIQKICSAKKYWIGILSNDVCAPKNGVYLIAYAGVGQGVDIEYRLRSMRQNNLFYDGYDYWAKPIAYHYLSEYSTSSEDWVKCSYDIHETIHAPSSGIPVLVYHKKPECNATGELGVLEYCFGNCPEDDVVWSGIEKGEDIALFKYIDWGRSNCWDGCIIVGYQMIYVYDQITCEQHLKLLLKNNPNIILD